MKQSILKRALLTACLGVSMAGVAMAGPVGPVIIPQAGDVVIINHGPDMTFTGNINFDVESQTNNNLQIGSTVIPMLYTVQRSINLVHQIQLSQRKLTYM